MLLNQFGVPITSADLFRQQADKAVVGPGANVYANGISIAGMTPRKYMEQAQAMYWTNPWIHAAEGLVSKKLATSDWKVVIESEDDDIEEKVKSGPAVEWLRAGSPLQGLSRSKLWQITNRHSGCCNNGFWYVAPNGAPEDGSIYINPAQPGATVEALAAVRTPKTWYLTSDGILKFSNSNDLEEIVETKYEDLGQIRQEYPYTENIFKSSALPPEIVNGLSVALDDFGDVPLIVRSSSLLEDRMGASFAGKYKSLFIANQGTKRERLAALVDAITEVYASTFGPDPIEYRAAQGLLEFHEEMGIMIQEVAGTKVGKYFIPAFSGVAFSNNEFRWSRRIRREDGLLRMVPGLGTRAVDRMSDDYPILVAPGQPTLRVNVTTDEQVRYSPRKVDVINIETKELESVDVHELMRECGNDFPLAQQLMSILRDDRLEQLTPSAPG